MEYKTCLIVKCTPLDDQWETDADRIPLCIVGDTTPYEGEGYEIYGIMKDGTLTQLKEYWEDYT